MVVKQKVIDISQFNNVVDWEKVKKTGYHVIIRIGYRGSHTGVITYDPRYKEYRDACEKYGIPYSFYFFPCSITDAEADEEALFIKQEVEASNIEMPVWLDSEVVQRDKSGRSDNLSKEKRTRYLKIILEKLLSWGIPCGIYASRSWYYNNIDMEQIPKDAVANTWVAEYGVGMTKYTGYFVMWQYSSKESVSGISGNVDMSNQYYDFYMDIKKDETSVNHGAETSSESVKEKSEVEKIIEVAKAEIGYLEKKSNSQLDSKTANAGYNNYTKYWRDVKPEWNGSYWCAAFCTWVFQTALGKERAAELLKHYPYVYCPTLGAKFTKYTTPKVGDIVIFWKNGAFAHTGIVIAVSGNKYTTIEGNTSGASSVVDNGGGVCQKTYSLSDLGKSRFCRPDYSSTTITDTANIVTVADDMHTAKWKGYVNIGNAKLAVRLQPSTSAKECSFSPLKNGTEVGVCYETGNWYLVKYDGKFGYAMKDYIGKVVEDVEEIIEPVIPPDSTSNDVKSESETEKSEVEKPETAKPETKPVDNIHSIKWWGVVNVKNGTLNVRTQPNSNASKCSFGPLSKGAIVGVCHRDGDWYLIKYNGKYGYVYSAYIVKK